jgi:exodeoxyribonuclease V alpha subunit
MMQHFPMLKRKLFYTGVTRGKKLVIMIGEKKALAVAIKEKYSYKRHTTLGEWLKGNRLRCGLNN